MIIDDLTPTVSDNLTDEIPVEQGTATLKTTWQKGLDLFASGASTPLMDGTASTGSASALSRSDHRHPTDTSRASTADITALDNSKVSKSGDTMSGALYINGAALAPISSDLEDGVAVGTNTAGDGRIVFADSKISRIGIISPRFRTDGKQGMRLYSNRTLNGSEVAISLEFGIDSSGTRYVDVGSAATAWRAAFGLGTSGAFPLTIAQGGTGSTAVASQTTASNIITAASGFTVSSASVYVWGKMAQLIVTVTKSSSQTSATTMTVGTLKTAYRPCATAGGVWLSSTLSFATVNSNGVIEAYGTWAANAEKTLCATFILP